MEPQDKFFDIVLVELQLGYTPPWTTNTGTVTSVNMTVPTGLSISGNPVTTSGTLALSLATGYTIPSTTAMANAATAYN